jgi:hypothetical protein
MRFSKWLTRGLAAALLASHGWLLAAQWQSGRLADPGVLLRWAAAIIVAAALTWVYRSGATLLSRKSVVIWLLAALLHAPAVASRIGADLTALPEAAAQTAAAAVAAATVMVFAAAVLQRRPIPAPATWSFVAALGGTALPADGFFVVVSARPPPARF